MTIVLCIHNINVLFIFYLEQKSYKSNEVCVLATKKVCTCYNIKEAIYFSITLDSNSWSDEGVTTVRIDDTIQCKTSHLTSFAVLVDVQGSSETTSHRSVLFDTYVPVSLTTMMFQALSTISYIGCGISICSLLLTMLAIVYWRYVYMYGTYKFCIHMEVHNFAINFTILEYP